MAKDAMARLSETNWTKVRALALKRGIPGKEMLDLIIEGWFAAEKAKAKEARAAKTAAE